MRRLLQHLLHQCKTDRADRCTFMWANLSVGQPPQATTAPRLQNCLLRALSAKERFCRARGLQLGNSLQQQTALRPLLGCPCHAQLGHSWLPSLTCCLLSPPRPLGPGRPLRLLFLKSVAPCPTYVPPVGVPLRSPAMAHSQSPPPVPDSRRSTFRWHVPSTQQ